MDLSSIMDTDRAGEQPIEDSKHRFSDRVEYYLAHRPRYPEGTVETLRREAGLGPGTVIADMGSGTGFLAQMLLRCGNKVHGVEPNREMREAGERMLGAHDDFISLNGSAEHSGLPDASVDLITAGQSFHWFDRPAARSEWSRILRPDGRVALVWNQRAAGSSAFMAAYETLLRDFGNDYDKVGHRDIDDRKLDDFFGPGRWRRFTLPYAQEFDREGLRGRILSSSYIPLPGQPRHAEMTRALDRLFECHQEQGRVRFRYHTNIYIGRLD